MSELELRSIDFDFEDASACATLADGTCVSVLHHYDNKTRQSKFLVPDGNAVTDITAEVVSWKVGACEVNLAGIDTCFLPDQYAVQWAWNGAGDLQSYDPVTGQWTDYGKTVDPDTGNVVGGYALAFKNDAIDPTIFFQRSGQLYRASPDDPIGTFKRVGPTLPAAPSSYPCFAFDPAGRLLAGIASGSTVVEIDPDTGAAINIGQLIDVRDGNALQAGPGDWYFDPNGDWFLMARDIRGTTFGESTGTVLWKIDPATLEATRVSDSQAPSSGTGAEWLSASTSLLSTSSTTLYEYNTLTDEWQVFANPALRSINDLSAQWIIPEPIRVTGFIEKGKPIEESSHCLFQWNQLPDNKFECVEFSLNLPGTLGKCAPDPNPFVSDPFSPTEGSGSDVKNPDQVWNEGCSAAGTTYFRTSCDEGGNEFSEYLYAGVTSPQTLQPNNFRPYPCDLRTPFETTQWCNNDVTPSETVYRRENRAGVVTWFDSTGTIAEPTDVDPGACPNIDSLITINEQVICSDGISYVRRIREVSVENAEGLPELESVQLTWYNQDGEFYDQLNTALEGVPTDPQEYYVGDCSEEFQTIEFQKLCEIDARFLLLIDSGGGFAKYSFYTGEWTNVGISGVTSAGGAADVENFLLYNFVAPNILTVVDVNTDTRLADVTLTSGVLKPGLTANPLTFSAASFRDSNGLIYAWDTGGTDAGLYAVNPQTGVVDFVTTISGVAGTGTSIAIDNTTDTLIINGSNFSYSVDWVTGVGTLWGNPPIQPNGSTFDTDGNFYVTQGNNTYSLAAGLDPNQGANYVQIIDDWTPGANSMAYYEVVAPQPSCFYRKFGISADPSVDPVYLSDHQVSDFSPRTIVGDVDCCECSCGGGSEGSSSGYAGPSAEDIGQEVEAQDTYKGPSAEDIATAMVLAERDSVEGRVAKFLGNATQQLPVAAGQRGNLLSIEDSGGGLVYFTLDGSAPSNTAGAQRGEVTGPYHASYNLRNVDLSQVRFDGSAGSADYTVWYEVFI